MFSQTFSLKSFASSEKVRTFAPANEGTPFEATMERVL